MATILLPARAPAPPATSQPLLFELIVADLHWTSLQVGMVLMVGAACAARGDHAGLRSVRHLSHDDTRVMQLALRYADTAGLTVAAQQRIGRLYADIGAARQQFGAFEAGRRVTPPQADQLARALPSWRKLAAAASEAIQVLEPQIRTALHPNYLADSATIRQFLARAARGDLSEVDRLGVLTPPALKQRRQSPRAALRRPCRVLFDGGAVDATLVDVSREGLGLLCGAPVALRTAVVVEVEGRRLEAVVARREGDQLGLSLKKPLFLTDPLYRAA